MSDLSDVTSLRGFGIVGGAEAELNIDIDIDRAEPTPNAGSKPCQCGVTAKRR
jgi:hypothetical protein